MNFSAYFPMTGLKRPTSEARKEFEGRVITVLADVSAKFGPIVRGRTIRPTFSTSGQFEGVVVDFDDEPGGSVDVQQWIVDCAMVTWGYHTLPLVPQEDYWIKDVHTWFELSYAQYLTIPRSVLQSMPDGWQERFTRCLQELDDLIDWRPKDGKYWVQLKDRHGRYREDPFMDYQRGRRRIPYRDGTALPPAPARALTLSAAPGGEDGTAHDLALIEAALSHYRGDGATGGRAERIAADVANLVALYEGQTEALVNAPLAPAAAAELTAGMARAEARRDLVRAALAVKRAHETPEDHEAQRKALVALLWAATAFQQAGGEEVIG